MCLVRECGHSLVHLKSLLLPFCGSTGFQGDHMSAEPHQPTIRRGKIRPHEHLRNATILDIILAHAFRSAGKVL